MLSFVCVYHFASWSFFQESMEALEFLSYLSYPSGFYHGAVFETRKCVEKLFSSRYWLEKLEHGGTFVKLSYNIVLIIGIFNCFLPFSM